jgi:hypothetical protein
VGRAEEGKQRILADRLQTSGDCAEVVEEDVRPWFQHAAVQGQVRHAGVHRGDELLQLAGVEQSQKLPRAVQERPPIRVASEEDGPDAAQRLG